MKAKSIKQNNSKILKIYLLITIIFFSLSATFYYGLISKNISQTTNSAKAASGNDYGFAMPSINTLRSSPKKVFAHYFTPYPIRVTSSGDYYETGYLNPNGEGGVHISYGGFLRDKPLFYGSGTAAQIEANRTIFESGLYQDVPLYEFNDMKQEILRASSTGLDGFTVDMLSADNSKTNNQFNNYNFRRIVALLYAVDWYNNLPEQIASNHTTDFKIILMPDATASAVNSSAQLAVAVNYLIDKFPSAMFKAGNNVVVSPFYPENLTPQWWINWLGVMKNTYSKDISFVPTFINFTDQRVTEYSGFSYGFSVFNTNGPASYLQAMADRSKAAGKPWMQGMAFQDNRPKAQIYYESNNSESFRGAWNIANNNADWVQLITWNDYSENTQFTASKSFGYNLLDLNAYYLAKYKTGNYPTITKDNVYIVHRKHNHQNLPNGTISGYNKFMQTLFGSSPPARNKVEIITMLTQPANLTVKVGTSTYTVNNAPVGFSTYLYDLAEGTLSATIARNGNSVASVVSPFTVGNNFAVQDLNYNIVSSIRNGTIATGVGDLDKNGKVNIIDLSILLNAWGTNNPNYDLQVDGKIDISDLVILLSKWGVIYTL